jgi:CheY-like chemotaxis protein
VIDDDQGIIAMSGPAKERLDLAKAVGADRVLSKPFVQEDRRSAIAAVLGAGRAG